MAYIDAEQLSKTFKVARHRRGFAGALRNLVSRQHALVKAVDGLSFHIQRGELVGFLGPNGAGKSTTVKMLTGILVPTEGQLSVGGITPWQRRVEHARRIGVVFGQRTSLWWDLPVVESFDLLRYIYKIPADRFRQNVKKFDDMLGLSEFFDTPVRSISLGQRMRADLAAAMLHDPEVVFLDEPTIGLDVVAKERIRTFIQQANERSGTTFILTTHDLGDVKKLCKRVLMVDHGRLLFDGLLHELQERFGDERELVVDFSEDYPHVSVNGAEVVHRDQRQVTYRFSRKTCSASELIQVLVQRYKIADLSVQEPEIENTIRRIYEQKLLQQLTEKTS